MPSRGICFQGSFGRRPDRADPVTHIGAIPAASPAHRAVGPRRRVHALRQRYDRAARLHSGPLLGEKEFAALEIHAGPG